MDGFRKIAVAACCALLLTACQVRDQVADTSTVDRNGVQPTLEQLNINGKKTEDDLVSDLAAKAGYKQKDGNWSPNIDWSRVAEAGFYEVGRQCDQYIALLFKFNRQQRALRQELTAAGAATATILGLASVAAAPIAITAAAFGLTASLFDANVNAVLFTVEPSALRTVVLNGRKTYVDNLDPKAIDSQSRMLLAVQGYLMQCTPASIEANVNNAANGLPSVSSRNPVDARAAATLGIPEVLLKQLPEKTTFTTSSISIQTKPTDK